MNNTNILNRKALAITIFLSLALLLLYPDAFSIPFFIVLGFKSYAYNDAKGSVLITLCSLEGEKGWGLSVLLANILYFLALPLIIYLLLSLGIMLLDSHSTKKD